MTARAALVVATAWHEDTQLARLFAPEEDAHAFASALRSPQLGGFDVQTLVNAEASTLRERIESFFHDGRQRSDTLLLYFSGHGVKDLDEGLLYFVASDTRTDRLRSTGVAASFVDDIIRTSPAQRKVLILDCCYSGAYGRSARPKSAGVNPVEELLGGHGRVVLTSSDAVQPSFEQVQADGMTRSTFTRALVDGLVTGEADLDGDGHITVDELYEHTRRSIASDGSRQRPGKWAFDVEGDIVIARAPARSEQADPTEPGTEPEPARSDAPKHAADADRARGRGVVAVLAALLVLALAGSGLLLLAGGGGDDDDQAAPATSTTVASGVAPALLRADTPEALSVGPLDGSVVKGPLYALVLPTEGITSVSFVVDDGPARTELEPPFNLGGDQGVLLPYDTTQLTDGPHRIAAIVTTEDGRTLTLAALVTVQNG